MLATGLGKTYLSIFVTEHFMGSNDIVLFLVNQKVIKDQAHQKYAQYFSNKSDLSET